MEDDELPPGEDSAPAESSPFYQEGLEAKAPGEAAAAAEIVQDAEEPAQEVLAPPPPPAAPKKEPTVIHVPLKIPEGARKKQVQLHSWPISHATLSSTTVGLLYGVCTRSSCRRLTISAPCRY